ncbi:sensor histidine kinase [Neptunomonas japonica]|uniref:sensor histidine kinase n=1 Tax=Neptunomonas japonica TaxID=417574 RepID=UPI0004906B85|nr:ATP-binding protein [Neptunomonas japonica]
MSLRLKTIMGVALIEAVLLLLLVSMTLDYLRSTNYDALIKRAATTATLFATTTKDGVLSYDLASLEAFVKDVLVNPDLVYARVLGPDKQLFAEGGKAEHLSYEFLADTSVEMVSDGVFDTFAVIREGGVIYGRVEIGLDISSINTTIAEAQNRSAIIAVVEMGLVALFSFLLGGYLTNQLKVLSVAAQKISEGNLDFQLPIKGQDEVSDVAIAFNSMAFNLREASSRRDQFESELKELNRSLEDRVELRTQQIRNKNTQLTQANQEIQEAQAKLLQSEKMASVGVLAAGVAHEINNPIGFVMSNLHTLESYGQNYRDLVAEYAVLIELTNADEQKEQRLKINQLIEQYDLEFMNEDLDVLLRDSIEGTERVKDIVKGLKDFSHVDSVTQFTMCDLNECIQSTLKVVNSELKYHCEIRTELNNLPLTYCCSGQINQVLLNLMINASHAIEKQGIIKVKSQQKGEWLEISVTDTGKGIPAEQLDKLFDPFYTTKPVGEGTGLGLSISYGIAKDHHGEIRVASALGKGSRFTLCIPITNDHD